MKQFVVVLILSAIFGNFLSWWIIAPIAFGAGYFYEKKAIRSFIVSFLALFLLWGALAFWMDFQNDSLLSNRISNMILSSNGSFIMILITALIGGLVSGLGGLSGSLLKNALIRR